MYLINYGTLYVPQIQHTLHSRLLLSLTNSPSMIIPNTVFIWIVAVTIINFSLAGVQLLIKGGFYLFWRDTFAPTRWYLVMIWLVFQDYFSNSRDIMIKKQQQNQTRDIFCHAFASNWWSFMVCERGHTHLIVFTHACRYYHKSRIFRF